MLARLPLILFLLAALCTAKLLPRLPAPEPMPLPALPMLPLLQLPADGVVAARKGDEIVACGQKFSIGTPVILWTDPDGYDAYSLEPRFAKRLAAATPRYNSRDDALSLTERDSVRDDGWTLPLLQSVVDQFVLHYDQSGTSRRCFEVLHDHRKLSIHFMLDLDGIIYQTLDLQERAWHATVANTRSIGIEIANVGAYPPGVANPFSDWYVRDGGSTRLRIPAFIKQSGIRSANFKGAPARDEPVRGSIHGVELLQYDFTPQQYEALVKLTAGLCRVFPKIKCDYPRRADGSVLAEKLPDAQLARYAGILGHYHVQANKIDPGPAFQWQRVIDGARKLLEE